MYGRNVHEAVWKAKERQTGITVHIVNEHYDEGSIIFQVSVPLDERDGINEIERKVRELESHSSKPESCFLEQDNSHGRKISRKIEVFKVRNNERQGFENLRRVIKVERRGSRGDKTYEETAYYISSLTESAQVFAKIIRGHWKIENQLHWVKDVIFEEDKSEISDFQAASNWSILTTIGLNLFRGLGFLSS